MATTGPELYEWALQLRQQADEWMDADAGWKGNLTIDQRVALRMADLKAAEVDATLALAAATALGCELSDANRAEWCQVASAADLGRTRPRPAVRR